MKKLCIVMATLLMSSVAFGQVHWGRFENRLDRSAKAAVEQAFSKEKSNRTCNGLADQIDMTVIYLNESEDSLGGDKIKFEVRLSGVAASAVVSVEAVDLYHSNEWTAKVESCDLHPTF